MSVEHIHPNCNARWPIYSGFEGGGGIRMTEECRGGQGNVYFKPATPQIPGTHFLSLSLARAKAKRVITNYSCRYRRCLDIYNFIVQKRRLWTDFYKPKMY